MGIDPKTGAMRRLRNKKTRREWASSDHPLALFSYQTLSQQDYARFFDSYVVSDEDWAKKDFGKPNMERFGAESQEWLPSVVDLQVEEDKQGHRLLARLEINDPEALHTGRASFPKKMYMELLLPKAEPVVHLNFSWFQKPATRLPEALWLSFNRSRPSRRAGRWRSQASRYRPWTWFNPAIVTCTLCPRDSATRTTERSVCCGNAGRAGCRHWA